MDPTNHVGSERSSWLARGAPLAVPVLLAVGLLILYELLPVLELTAIAALLALILRTFVLLLERIGLRPWVAILVLFGLLAASGAFIWLAVVPNLVEEIVVLASAVPDYVNSLATLFSRLQVLGLVSDLYGDLSQLQGYLNELLGSLPALLTTATNLIVAAIATMVMALYMAYDPGSLIRGILRLVPRQRRERTRKVIENLEVRLRGWIVGMALAMLIVGTGAGIGLWILGVPLALTFGILAGLLELIPYFGQVLGALLPALIALTISPIKALLVVVLFIILNQVDGHLVQPLVMGRRVNLHPVVVILSFLVFGELLGFIGVLLAVPAAAFLVTLVDEITAEQDLPEEEPPKDSNQQAMKDEAPAVPARRSTT